MYKNAAIVSMVIVLALMTYRYVILPAGTNHKKDDNSVSNASQMELHYNPPNWFSVVSKDGNFKMYFFYGADGLEAFGVRDSLSNKNMDFNFSGEGILASYFYQDNLYSIKTNTDLFNRVV